MNELNAVNEAEKRVFMKFNNGWIWKFKKVMVLKCTDLMEKKMMRMK